MGGVHNRVAEPLAIEDLLEKFIRFRISPLAPSFRFSENAKRFATFYPPAGVADQESTLFSLSVPTVREAFITQGVLLPGEGCPAVLQRLATTETWASSAMLEPPSPSAVEADLVLDTVIGTFDMENIYTLRLRGSSGKSVDVPIWRQSSDYTSEKPGVGFDRAAGVRSWKNVRFNSVGVQVHIPAEVIGYLGSPFAAELEFAANLNCKKRRDGPGFVLGYEWTWKPRAARFGSRPEHTETSGASDPRALL